MQIKTVLAVGSLVTFSSLTAAAQPADPNAPAGTPPSALPPPATPAPATATAQVGPGGAVAVATAPAANPEKAGDTDHEKYVGHFAVGYLGFTSVPLATVGSVQAPVVGVRYWLNERMGLDLGLGLHLDGGSSSAGANSTDKASIFAAAIHGGIPLVFGTGKHYTFALIPETNIGFASSTVKGTGGGPDTSLSGFNLDLGARIGSEIHFGFIGVPELSLQATVGAAFRYQTTGTDSNGNSTSDSSYLLQTSVQNSPWGIFTNSLSAFYYFP